MGKAEFKFEEIGKLGESILVQKMTGNGEVYFRITKLYKDVAGEWKPTNKGCSIPLMQCELLLMYLERFIKENGKDEPENESLTSDLEELPF